MIRKYIHVFLDFSVSFFSLIYFAGRACLPATFIITFYEIPNLHIKLVHQSEDFKEKMMNIFDTIHMLCL
jgi:hypothetical protein